jgi:thiamine-phosphate pyrophosphorylase
VPCPPVSLPLPIRKSSTVCYVTDRWQLSVSLAEQHEKLLAKIVQAASAGVDWIQIREKDLSAARIAALAREVLAKVPPDCRVILNDRLDVACAVHAGGVHLGEKSISVADARIFVRDRRESKNLLIGASVHSLEAAQNAEAQGAAYVMFGPVFATPSKAPFGDPQGLERLAAVCAHLTIPVLAIGGITQENARDCYLRGASGVAGIRLFQEAGDLQALVQTLRG